MRQIRLLPIALTLATLLPTSLAAAEGTASSDEVVRYDFEDDLIHGDLAFPSGERLSIRPHGGRRTLIRAREHFVPEMMHSVEDL